MSLFPQRCKVCGKRDKLDYTVPDDVWAAVVPEPYRKLVVCLSCFDNFASARGVNYAKDIGTEILFVGDMASFTLRVISREDGLQC